MKYLADTNIILKAFFDDTKLPKNIRDILENGSNDIYVSIVSFWEAKIKQSIHNLAIKDEFYDSFENHGFKLLDMKMNHIKAVGLLPMHHKDPFDRIIISQALTEGLAVITYDKEFKKYPVKVILAE